MSEFWKTTFCCVLPISATATIVIIILQRGFHVL